MPVMLTWRRSRHPECRFEAEPLKDLGERRDSLPQGLITGRLSEARIRKARDGKGGREGAARRKPCRVSLRLNPIKSAAAYTGKWDGSKDDLGRGQLNKENGAAPAGRQGPKGRARGGRPYLRMGGKLQ